MIPKALEMSANSDCFLTVNIVSSISPFIFKSEVAVEYFFDSLADTCDIQFFFNESCHL